MSLIAVMMFFRASVLSAGATESSRSRLITSASDAAIFGKIAGRDPGPKSWQRFGRAGGWGWTRKDMDARKFISFWTIQPLGNCAALRKSILRTQKGPTSKLARCLCQKSFMKFDEISANSATGRRTRAAPARRTHRRALRLAPEVVAYHRDLLEKTRARASITSCAAR